MSRRRRSESVQSRTRTTPMPFETLQQTAEYWVAFWEAQRKETERGG